MSDLGLQMSPDSKVPQGPHHHGRSWLAVAASLAVIGSILLGVTVIIGKVPIFGAPPANFTGEGTEPVQVRVEQGQTLAQIGQTLKEAGVVASVDAWLEACAKEPKSATIGPALYNLRLEMSAEAALERMLDPDTRVVNQLLLREGLRIWETFAAINEAAGISVSRLEKTAKKSDIGLPRYAEDNAEGFLFPATYDLDPKESAKSVLTKLVTRWDKAADSVGLTAGAKKLGLTPYEALIVASLVQAEGHPDDFTKVARVIYNRLDEDTWGGTYGKLEMDATLNYALRKSDINLTLEELKNTDSPFNTYQNTGLPPTPINSPGEAAMAAALNPADGDWLWYVTVNPDSGETKFTNDYDEFLKFKEELSAWHEANDG